MPFSMNCPTCGEAVEVAEEHRGWQVRCPVCGSEFQAGEAPPTPPRVLREERGYSSRPGRFPADEDDRDWEYERRRSAYREAVAAVSGPATALKIIGWMGVVLSIVGVLIWVMLLAAALNAQGNQNGNMQKDEVIQQSIFYIPQGVISFGVSVLMLIGAGKMGRMENYGWARTAAILGMIPCISPCCVLGLPFGIWALNTLNRPEVQAAFERRSLRFETDEFPS